VGVGKEGGKKFKKRNQKRKQEKILTIFFLLDFSHFLFTFLKS